MRQKTVNIANFVFTYAIGKSNPVNVHEKSRNMTILGKGV